MPKGEPYSFERGLFPTLLEHKEPVLSFILDQVLDRYRNAAESISKCTTTSWRQVLFASGAQERARPFGPTRQTSIVDEKSIIDADVTIRGGVRIENSVIGRNCKIEEGAQIIDSVIWSGNTIDADARLSEALSAKVAMSAGPRPCGLALCSATRPSLTDFLSSYERSDQVWYRWLARDHRRHVYFRKRSIAAQATADTSRPLKDANARYSSAMTVAFCRPFRACRGRGNRRQRFSRPSMDRPYPTPYVSFEVRRRRFAGGIVITASHNPPAFNGFKVKATSAEAPPRDITAEIEASGHATGRAATPPKASKLWPRGPLFRASEIPGGLGPDREVKLKSRCGFDARQRGKDTGESAARYVVHGGDNARESRSTVRRRQSRADDAAIGAAGRPRSRDGSESVWRRTEMRTGSASSMRTGST